MSGMSPNIFIRKAIPKDFFCPVCLQILVTPIYCPNCRVIACATCLPKTVQGSKCSHEGRVSEATLSSKISELYVKCKYWTHGCMKLNRFADIQNHEAKCIFSQTHCNQPGCIHHNTEKRLDKHVLVCPLEHIRCEVHSFEPGKIIEDPCHSCSQWLKDVSENFELRTSIYKDENEELRQEMYAQKIAFEATRMSTKTKISETDANNQKLELNLRIMKEKYEEKIRKLEEESAYKMKCFHETADKRIKNYLKNTNDNFNQFAEKLRESVIVYLENVNKKAIGYNESVEKRADGFIDRKVLESVKASGSKVKGNNNKTMLSGGSTNNTTIISNANNSILK